jgi:putative GTP pyrophosphokinase
MAARLSKSRNQKERNQIMPEFDQVWKTDPETVRQFLEQRPDYEQLCTEVAYILKKKLQAAGIEISTVSSRAKTLNSFLEKISRKSYEKPFERITDFAGVRVVYLYNTDVSEIEKIIQEEFEIKEKVDKTGENGVDKFGYGAIHFIISLSKKTSGARYDDLKRFVCEIQVRTVLQDAWAIIDHHLVYKNESDVPSPLRRKLNSLAGVFETADDQFEQIRTARVEYANTVSDSIKNSSDFLRNELNLDTLVKYIAWKYKEDEENSLLMFNLTFPNVTNYMNYSSLADLDADIEKSKTIISGIVEKNYRENIDKMDGFFTFITSLLLVNPQIRPHLGAPRHAKEIIQKYGLQSQLHE